VPSEMSGSRLPLDEGDPTTDSTFKQRHSRRDVIACFGWGSLAGPVGAFLALPTAALISSFVSYYATTHEVVYESPSTNDTEQPTKASD